MEMKGYCRQKRSIRKEEGRGLFLHNWGGPRFRGKPAKCPSYSVTSSDKSAAFRAVLNWRTSSTTFYKVPDHTRCRKPDYCGSLLFYADNVLVMVRRQLEQEANLLEGLWIWQEMIWLVRRGCSEQHEPLALSDRGKTARHGFRLRSSWEDAKGLYTQE